MKCWTGSNFGQIGSVNLELHALRIVKKLLSVTFGKIFVKFAGNDDRHKSLDYSFWSHLALSAEIFFPIVTMEKMMYPSFLSYSEFSLLQTYR